MPSNHAVLGPSASHRWLSCPGSVRLSSGIVDVGSSAAEEGTRAHSVAEYWTRILTGDDTAVELDRPDEDMHRHGKAYAEFVKSRIPEGGTLLLEQRVQTGLEGCWGTSDAIIAGPGFLEIVDYKYGSGMFVEAEDNPQLKLYALGAMELFEDIFDFEEVLITVYQPRMDNIQTWGVSAKELLDWREEIRPTAEQALGDDAPVIPSEEACQWCPARGVCSVRQRLLMEEFEDLSERPADLLSDDDLARAMALVPELRAWTDAVQSAVFERVYHRGARIQGWKVVKGSVRRKVMDVDELVRRLVGQGFRIEDVASFKHRPLSELERLVGGKDVFDTLAEGCVGQVESAPRVVAETATGEPITSKDSLLASFDD